MADNKVNEQLFHSNDFDQIKEKYPQIWEWLVEQNRTKSMPPLGYLYYLDLNKLPIAYADQPERAYIDWLCNRFASSGASEIVSLAYSAIEALTKGFYSDLTRFITELLQNADDCKYGQAVPTLEIEMYPPGYGKIPSAPAELNNTSGVLVFKHNEIGFSMYNLYALCSCNKSDKWCDNTLTGKKGIGFKSIFGIASDVYIASSNYFFNLSEESRQGDSLKSNQNGSEIKFKSFKHERFDSSDKGLKYVVPFWVDGWRLDELDKEKTCMFFPLSEEKLAENSSNYASVTSSLNLNLVGTFLFLKQIHTIILVKKPCPKGIADQNEHTPLNNFWKIEYRQKCERSDTLDNSPLLNCDFLNEPPQYVIKAVEQKIFPLYPYSSPNNWSIEKTIFHVFLARYTINGVLQYEADKEDKRSHQDSSGKDYKEEHTEVSLAFLVSQNKKPSPTARTPAEEDNVDWGDNDQETFKSDGLIYVYLPTKIQTYLPFHINASFRLSPNRQNLDNCSWNLELMARAFDLFERAVLHFKDNCWKGVNNLSFSFFFQLFEGLKRIDQDHVIKPLFEGFFSKVQSMFAMNRLVPARDGSFVSLDEVKIPDPLYLANIFTDAELQIIMHDSRKSCKWADPRIKKNASAYWDFLTTGCVPGCNPGKTSDAAALPKAEIIGVDDIFVRNDRGVTQEVMLSLARRSTIRSQDAHNVHDEGNKPVDPLEAFYQCVLDNLSQLFGKPQDRAHTADQKLKRPLYDKPFIPLVPLKNEDGVDGGAGGTTCVELDFACLSDPKDSILEKADYYVPSDVTNITDVRFQQAGIRFVHPGYLNVFGKKNVRTFELLLKDLNIPVFDVVIQAIHVVLPEYQSPCLFSDLSSGRQNQYYSDLQIILDAFTESKGSEEYVQSLQYAWFLCDIYGTLCSPENLYLYPQYEITYLDYQHNAEDRFLFTKKTEYEKQEIQIGSGALSAAYTTTFKKLMTQLNVESREIDMTVIEMIADKYTDQSRASDLGRSLKENESDLWNMEKAWENNVWFGDWTSGVFPAALIGTDGLCHQFPDFAQDNLRHSRNEANNNAFDIFQRESVYLPRHDNDYKNSGLPLVVFVNRTTNKGNAVYSFLRAVGIPLYNEAVETIHVIFPRYEKDLSRYSSGDFQTIYVAWNNRVKQIRNKDHDRFMRLLTDRMRMKDYLGEVCQVNQMTLYPAYEIRSIEGKEAPRELLRFVVRSQSQYESWSSSSSKMFLENNGFTNMNKENAPDVVWTNIKSLLEQLGIEKKAIDEEVYNFICGKYRFPKSDGPASAAFPNQEENLADIRNVYRYYRQGGQDKPELSVPPMIYCLDGVYHALTEPQKTVWILPEIIMDYLKRDPAGEGVIPLKRILCQIPNALFVSPHYFEKECNEKNEAGDLLAFSAIFSDWSIKQCTCNDIIPQWLALVYSDAYNYLNPFHQRDNYEHLKFIELIGNCSDSNSVKKMLEKIADIPFVRTARGGYASLKQLRLPLSSMNRNEDWNSLMIDYPAEDYYVFENETRAFFQGLGVQEASEQDVANATLAKYLPCTEAVSALDNRKDLERLNGILHGAGRSSEFCLSLWERCRKTPLVRDRQGKYHEAGDLFFQGGIARVEELESIPLPVVAFDYFRYELHDDAAECENTRVGRFLVELGVQRVCVRALAFKVILPRYVNCSQTVWDKAVWDQARSDFRVLGDWIQKNELSRKDILNGESDEKISIAKALECVFRQYVASRNEDMEFVIERLVLPYLEIADQSNANWAHFRDVLRRTPWLRARNGRKYRPTAFHLFDYVDWESVKLIDGTDSRRALDVRQKMARFLSIPTSYSESSSVLWKIWYNLSAFWGRVFGKQRSK